LIGSRKDMEEVVRLADKHKLSVVLEKLKNSEIEARAVLVP